MERLLLTKKETRYLACSYKKEEIKLLNTNYKLLGKTPTRHKKVKIKKNTMPRKFL
jgi:hypothetical protein